MNRSIKKVVVLGAGIMGSRIALHFANIGVEVLLLDMVPREPNDAEKAKGQDTTHPAVRNRIVSELFQAAVKASPSPIYSPKSLSRVKLGNFDDDMPKIATYDWIIEVVFTQKFSKVFRYLEFMYINLLDTIYKSIKVI